VFSWVSDGFFGCMGVSADWSSLSVHPAAVLPDLNHTKHVACQSAKNRKRQASACFRPLARSDLRPHLGRSARVCACSWCGSAAKATGDAFASRPASQRASESTPEAGRTADLQVVPGQRCGAGKAPGARSIVAKTAPMRHGTNTAGAIGHARGASLRGIFNRANPRRPGASHEAH